MQDVIIEIDNRGNGGGGKEDIYGKLLNFLLIFYVNLKFLLKVKSTNILKKKKDSLKTHTTRK